VAVGLAQAYTQSRVDAPIAPHFKGSNMNDNYTTDNTKTAIVTALVTEAGLTLTDANKAVEFLTTEGVIDFPVANELYA
jgi:hypothetical protein